MSDFDSAHLEKLPRLKRLDVQLSSYALRGVEMNGHDVPEWNELVFEVAWYAERWAIGADLNSGRFVIPFLI